MQRTTSSEQARERGGACGTSSAVDAIDSILVVFERQIERHLLSQHLLRHCICALSSRQEKRTRTAKLLVGYCAGTVEA
jgi:hypothetical protein